jgi:hypothetical protein
LAEVGTDTSKCNGNEALRDESLFKRNGDEVLNDDFPYKVTAMRHLTLSKES